MGERTPDSPTRRIARGDPLWPARFASVEVEPTALWLRGRCELLDAPRRVAIVGSRSPTPYGLAQATRFARALAECGVAVVSGLARGVDEAAHWAALDANGATIAVLGCGVDRPWPGGPLADRVTRDGLALSEFAPGVGPRRHHFPLRNRIIAALSDAVLVIEAAHASGSLITARWAADQGQTVFALPGRVDHPMARGTLRLIREGATAVDSPRMLLEDLYGEGLAPDDGPSRPDPRWTDDEKALVSALTGETLAAADVATRAEVELTAALAGLTSLELAGVVRRGPGGLYSIS